MRNKKMLQALGLLVLALLMISVLNVEPVQAQSSGPTSDPTKDEGFLFPYQGKTFYFTNGAPSCHTDGWGKYYAGTSDGPCSIDFTHYSGGEAINCGEPAYAPVSGEFFNLGTDSQGNTVGLLKGTRYWVLMLHGDFVVSGHLNQGDVMGYENTHGKSTACHWHMDVRDVIAGSWVNVATMQYTTIPDNVGMEILPVAGDPLIEKLKGLSIQVNSYAVTATPITPATAEAPVAFQPAQTEWVASEASFNGIPSNWITFGLAFVLVVGLVMIVVDRNDKGWWLIAIALVVGWYLYYQAGFTPDYTVPVSQSGEGKLISNPSPEEVARQQEEDRIISTNVNLTLPSDFPKNGGGGTAFSGNYTTPPSGSCAISPNWPESIQQWCVWLTQYAPTIGGYNADWAAAQMLQESNGRANALGMDCEPGLLQVVPSDGIGVTFINNEGELDFKCDLQSGTHQAFTDVHGQMFSNRPTMAQLWDPEFNIKYAMAKIKYHLEQGSSVADALLRYNGGSDYVIAVQNHYNRYRP